MSEMTEDRWQEILVIGKGYVFNDFSGKNPSGKVSNVLHRAKCYQLKMANLSVNKEFFETADQAIKWLDLFRRGNWKPCGVCCRDIVRRS